MKLKEIKFNDIPKECKKYVLGFSWLYYQELKNTEFYRKKIEDLEQEIINLRNEQRI